MRKAHEDPTNTYQCGRIAFSFQEEYLGGSLSLHLPSGRVLTYRALRWETVHEYDDDGAITDSKWELTFARGYGRIKLWPGFFVENVTQAVAADVLRGTLTRIDGSPAMPMIRAHTHDEVLLEVNVDRADDVAVRLKDIMEQGFDWSDGLPLKAEITSAYAYTKCKKAQGL
jgi:hypothetical protein